MNEQQIKINLMNSLKQMIESALKNQSAPILPRIEKEYIFKKLIKIFMKELGDEFNPFSSYILSRNLSIYINSIDFVLTICFHNGFTFLKIEEVLDDYFKSKISKGN